MGRKRVQMLDFRMEFPYATDTAIPLLHCLVPALQGPTLNRFSTGGPARYGDNDPRPNLHGW